MRRCVNPTALGDQQQPGQELSSWSYVCSSLCDPHDTQQLRFFLYLTYFDNGSCAVLHS